MELLTLLSLNLPLENPVLIFALMLFIMLFTPILLNKFNIPQLIGLIVAGIIVGPHGLGLLARDSSIELFGTVGLLYIMFMSGIETNVKDFRKNIFKSSFFSLLTFGIPMFLGFLSSKYLLGFSDQTSVLLASMYASNTLITYPMVSKFGISKNRVVNIAVSGTLVTTVLALLVLAVVVGMTKGQVNQAFWIKISVSLVVFILVIMIGFPILSRWFFKRYDDNISQYIFVLGMMYIGAFLAEFAGIDKIVGAFLAGLALNSLIPQTSPLMNRINFVGNALFIPFFLIGVGMLIDLKAFFQSWSTIWVALVMTVVATFSKYVAAWLTQKTFKYTNDERDLLFGLTNAQAASTLAAVLVGYNIILNQPEIDAAAALGEVIEPERLLNESVLNGTILMILVTCTIASLFTQRGGRKIALHEATTNTEDDHEWEERILAPINNPENIDELINLGVTIKSKKSKQGLYALSIITSAQSESESESGSVSTAEKIAKDNLHKASVAASGSDNDLKELLRYDNNVVSGILNVVREHKITDVILGLHQKKGITGSFLGHLSEGILAKCNVTTMIYRPVQPMSTIKRHLVVVPENAELVIGFQFWVNRMVNIAKNTGAKITFYGSLQTIEYLKKSCKGLDLSIDYEQFDDWNDFLIISRDLKKNENLVIVLSRKNHLSYNAAMGKIPTFLNKYFDENSYLLIYPMQRGLDNVSEI